MKLRVMMRMMGLGTAAYWVINYLFWFLMYAAFTIIFVLLGSVVSLPSGYKLGIFTRQDYRWSIARAASISISDFPSPFNDVMRR